jgi:hypothetical protein
MTLTKEHIVSAVADANGFSRNKAVELAETLIENTLRSCAANTRSVSHPLCALIVSGHKIGQKLVLDVDGNFITKLCPSRICVYLASQLTIPIALINERLSEKLKPNDFHFMRFVRCPDVGVECLGYGEVKLKVEVVPRKHT